MTYDELVKSIESLDAYDGMAPEIWLRVNAPYKVNEARDVREDWQVLALEAARMAYEAAASDPNAWCFPDKNGEFIHLKDKVRTNDGIMVVTEISANVESMEDRIIGSDSDGGFTYNPWHVEKIIPATKEKIIEDIAKAFKHTNESSYPETMDRCREAAAKWYDIIEANVKAELGDA